MAFANVGSSCVKLSLNKRIIRFVAWVNIEQYKNECPKSYNWGTYRVTAEAECGKIPH